MHSIDVRPPRQGLRALAVAIVAAVIASPGLSHPLSPFDGGISASAGTFVAHGLVPYRDFWLLYGPLSAYLVALPSVVLGPSVELVRVLGLSVLATQAAVSYLLLSRIGPAFGSGLVSVAAAALPVPFLGLDLSAWALSVTLVLTALLMGTAADTGGRRSVINGVILALAFLTRLDVGAYGLLALMTVRRSRGLAAGFGAAVAPVTIALLMVVPLEALFEQLIWYPVVGTRVFRALPGPPVLPSADPRWWGGFLVVLVPRILIALAILRVARGEQRSPAATGLLIFAALCQLQTLGRADLPHFAQAAGPAILLLGVWLQSGDRPLHPRMIAMAGVTALLLAPSTARLAAVVLSGAADPKSPYDLALLSSVDLVSRCTAPDEPIFVGDAMNRYTHTNPLLVYYLADRRPGVRDTMYNPGITNRDVTQAQMVADLEASGTDWLVLDRPSGEVFERENESRVPGSSRLDDYIRDAFELAADYDAFVVMRRSGEPLLPGCAIGAPMSNSP